MVFIPPEIVVFDNTGFGGVQRRFNVDIGELDWYTRDILPASGTRYSWSEAIQSVIVISGTWQFFPEPNYSGVPSKQVPPGTYSNVELPEFNILKRSITSFKVISYDPQGDGFVWL
jgi:hypothetical protein